MQKHTVCHLLCCCLLLSCLFLPPSPAAATELYAQQTGQACAVCHVSPGGGGELTAAGEKFFATQPGNAEKAGTTAMAKWFRLAVGYIHFLTAIFWFGTILYVHLILKPAYAVGGLPRGELRVGIISMVVMGITGLILTFQRIPSFEQFFQSRFGLLLLIKICLYLLMVTSAVFVITVIGPRLKAKRKEPSVTEAGGELTLESLGAFDGHEGRPAYFAFEGTVYDATSSKLWKQGVHMGRHHAGTDLTEALKLAPHGREKVEAMATVGKLVAAVPQKAPLHERVFFFMAYMNLAIVFIITMILSLWRWG